MAPREVMSEDLQYAHWRAQLPHLGNDAVLLRELQPTDAPTLYRLVRDPAIARQTWPPPTTVEAIERFIEWTWTERAAGRYVGFGIVPRGTHDAAGLFELRKLQPDFFRAELGFFLDPALWGTGLFDTASQVLLDFAFGVLGVHRIEARVSVDNARSNGALRRIGARHEGILRAAFARDGEFVDQNLWAIVTSRHERSHPARGRRSTIRTAGR